MSLAVNLTMKLTEVAATALKDHPSGADVEIIERHHRFKEDAPSGTALKFGEIIAQRRWGKPRRSQGRHGRPGQRPARRDRLSRRARKWSDNPGEHTIVFGLLGESFELNVQGIPAAIATPTACARRPPRVPGGQAGRGMYGMNDVLGF